MRRTLYSRKFVIYSLMILGFVMLESPMILVANQVEPMIMNIPFFLLWNLGWWAFITILFLVAYVTDWGSSRISSSLRKA